MTHPLVILTYIVGAGELVLALYFLKTNSGATIRKVMTIMCLAGGIWTIASAFSSYHDDSGVFHITNVAVYIAGILFITSLVHLAIIYPYRAFAFDSLHTLLLYVPFLLFSIILIFSRTVFVGAIGNENISGHVVPGPLFVVYNLFFILLYFLSIIILYYKARKNVGFQRRHILIFITSLVIGGIPAVFIDLMAPLFGYQDINPLIGTIASVIWLGGVTYILVDKGKGAR